ncbi:hypothetical protein TrispH2_011989, partial [Trichoplax sp. H2]
CQSLLVSLTNGVEPDQINQIDINSDEEYDGLIMKAANEGTVNQTSDD